MDNAFCLEYPCREASTHCVVLMMATHQVERMAVYDCGIRTSNQSPEWTLPILQKVIKVKISANRLRIHYIAYFLIKSKNILVSWLSVGKFIFLFA